MSQTDAPSWPLGHVLGREFRPFAFIISLSTARVTASLLTATVTGSTLKGPLGAAFGLVALVSVGFLWAGWWGRKDRWMTEGLLLSACVWSGVAGILVHDQGWNSTSAFLAACWAIAAGERWLLAVRRDRAEE